MRSLRASRIMPRTTIDLDPGVLRELKRRKRSSGRSIGQIASEMLAAAMGGSTGRERPPEPMRWRSVRMGARVDLDDKEAVRRALDGQ
jgi:hypothetical protein